MSIEGITKGLYRLSSTLDETNSDRASKRSRFTGESNSNIHERYAAIITQTFQIATTKQQQLQNIMAQVPSITQNAQFVTCYQRVQSILQQCANYNALLTSHAPDAHQLVITQKERIVRDYLWLRTGEFPVLSELIQLL